MDGPSAYALACDLLGEELSGPHQARPTVAGAARRLACGQLMAARVDGRDVVVVKLEDGRVFALPDHCPHAGVPLSDGFVEAGRLVCPRHGWEVDVQTGECIGRPHLRVPVERIR